MHPKGDRQGHQQSEARHAGEAQAERGRRRADVDVARSLLEREHDEVQRAAEWYDFLAVDENFGVWIPGMRNLYVAGRIALDPQKNPLERHGILRDQVFRGIASYDFGGP